MNTNSPLCSSLPFFSSPTFLQFTHHSSPITTVSTLYKLEPPESLLSRCLLPIIRFHAPPTSLEILRMAPLHNIGKYAYQPSGVGGRTYVQFETADDDASRDPDIVITHQAVTQKGDSSHIWTADEMKSLLTARRFTTLNWDGLAVVLNRYFPRTKVSFRKKMVNSCFNRLLRATENSVDGQIWSCVYNDDFVDPSIRTKEILSALERYATEAGVSFSKKNLEDTRVLRLFERHHQHRHHRFHQRKKITTTRRTRLRAVSITSIRSVQTDFLSVREHEDENIMMISRPRFERSEANQASILKHLNQHANGKDSSTANKIIDLTSTHGMFHLKILRSL
jgi:hypothetical protein